MYSILIVIGNSLATLCLIIAYEIVRFVFITILLENIFVKTKLHKEKEDLESYLIFLRNEAEKESKRLWELNLYVAILSNNHGEKIQTQNSHQGKRISTRMEKIGFEGS